ncbi:Uncharacterised protein [Neisseria animaloris]|uniref:Uncharacterized protein n=1 Tax=Neisseria animaloris TaxID=326522 RepID=A0A3S4YBG2_9NEIS|nr:Uncharacterised protein [Neisseria animaloris]VEJ21846.1 Uncharacterised protein [Neisseria animaloris]
MTSYNHPDNSLLTGDCHLVLPEQVQQGVKIQSYTTSLEQLRLRQAIRQYYVLFKLNKC